MILPKKITRKNLIWLFSLLWLFPFILTLWLFYRDEERHCDFRVSSFDSRKESKCNSYKKITVWIFNNKKRNKIRQRRISLMQIKILSSSEHNTTQLYEQTACNEFKETRYFKSYCNFWKSEKRVIKIERFRIETVTFMAFEFAQSTTSSSNISRSTVQWLRAIEIDLCSLNIFLRQLPHNELKNWKHMRRTLNFYRDINISLVENEFEVI